MLNVSSCALVTRARSCELDPLQLGHRAGQPPMMDAALAA
jgi:hypothetical protein